MQKKSSKKMNNRINGFALSPKKIATKYVTLKLLKNLIDFLYQEYHPYLSSSKKEQLFIASNLSLEKTSLVIAPLSDNERPGLA